QRHRHRPGILRAHLPHVPAPARQGRVSRHGDRPHHLQENRRPPRRTHLGGVAARPRLHLPFHPAQAAKGRRSNPMTASAESTPPVEILLVEDNPGDVRLTKEALREVKVYSTLHWAK